MEVKTIISFFNGIKYKNTNEYIIYIAESEIFDNTIYSIDERIITYEELLDCIMHKNELNIHLRGLKINKLLNKITYNDCIRLELLSFIRDNVDFVTISII